MLNKRETGSTNVLRWELNILKNFVQFFWVLRERLLTGKNRSKFWLLIIFLEVKQKNLSYLQNNQRRQLLSPLKNLWYFFERKHQIQKSGEILFLENYSDIFKNLCISFLGSEKSRNLLRLFLQSTKISFEESFWLSAQNMILLLFKNDFVDLDPFGGKEPFEFS